ncbi:MAG: GntR family transcriptional regulator [Streptosporangiales bacterium]|nr:GntR family transcriptional regulator [Streptosporangiales bacterium]
MPRHTPRKRETIKYRDVADELRRQITEGVLPAGSILPSESEVIAEFDVSRSTARNAINQLRAEGLITVQHGRGAFVRRADRARHTHTRALYGTRNQVANTADPIGDPAWRDVEESAHYRTNATAPLALALGVAEHTPVFLADRLLEGPLRQRVAYRLYVPITTAAECPPLEKNPFLDPVDLYTALTDTFGSLTWTEYVQTRIPTPDDTGALRASDNAPLLITRRVTTDNHGRILAMEETRHAGEDTQLAYPMTPTKRART